MEREGVSTLSIRGFSRALKNFAHFEIALCVCFEKKIGLPSDNSCFFPQECDKVVFENGFESVCVEKFDFEQVPTSFYLLEKRIFLFLFPLDSSIPVLVSR